MIPSPRLQPGLGLGCETRLLLREFTHRVNNDFTSAISVVSLAAARSRSDEVKAALSAVQDRLLSYASVHRALQMPEHSTLVEAASYLRQLCRAISCSKLECRGIRLVLAVQQLRMDSDACWRLGMIVSELVTNAARHAFGEGGGEIRVELKSSSNFVAVSPTTAPRRRKLALRAASRSLRRWSTASVEELSGATAPRERRGR